MHELPSALIVNRFHLPFAVELVPQPFDRAAAVAVQGAYSFGPKGHDDDVGVHQHDAGFGGNQRAERPERAERFPGAFGALA